ncbi:MAG: FMN-binding glutamate synthase family protein, partial [Nitrospinae bacterium]|nr:FMN-binding glutamate synthase family protein [Nitrospinota bacterium]
DDHKCTGCQRCVLFCPTFCIDVKERKIGFKKNAHWNAEDIRNINKQAKTGGVLLTGMGNDKPFKEYWDHMLLDASQVTNPSIDPLREPMELSTFLGRKPDMADLEYEKDGKPVLKTKLPPQLELKRPVMFSAMSYGSINYNFAKAMAMASKELGIYYNTGEGGLHETLYKYKANTIVQVASGRFGVHPDYLNAGAAVEIKIGQGAKPGIGGHLPGEKIFGEVARTRMIPVGSDAISPAPHHDIYSIEDLRQLIYALKEATNYEKPISVKIAAVHNAPAIASGMVRAGADIIVLDGFRGGTGAAPTMIRDNVGIPIELALAAVDQRLRDEEIRTNASLLVAGGFRNAGDVIKAIALGADAVYIGSSAAIAVGCTLCQKCYMGKCAWGITTNRPDLMKRLVPEIAAEQLYNLITGWSHEMEEILGGMGLNSIESLRGNRLKLRGVGLSQNELDTLGILGAGQ